MSDLELLYNEHRELLRLFGEILTIASEIEPSTERLVAARRALAQASNRHIVNKNRIVSATLQASPDPAHRTLGRRYVEDLLRLRQNTTHHYAQWTIQNAMADLREFRLAVRSHQKVVKTRLDWEEREVFPVLAPLLDTGALRRAG